MKRILVLFAMCMLIMAPVSAATNISKISVGKKYNQYDWIQGVADSDEGLFVLDGTKIKRIEGKSSEVYYDIQDLQLLLPKSLQDKAILSTFLMGQMDYYNGALYVSGLLFKDTAHQKKKIDNQYIAGETYSVVFMVKDKKASLIHASLSFYNKVHQFNDFHETPSGMREDVFYIGGQNVVAFGKYVNKPRFTFSDEGDLVYTAQRYLGNMQSAVDVFIYKSKAEKIYTLRTYEDEHVIATLNEGILTLYYDTTSWGDMYNVRVYDIESDYEDQYQLPDSFVPKKPKYIDGQMYFLNDQGIFTVTQDGEQFLFDWFLMAEATPVKAYITDWDYDGEFVYLTDFEQRIVYKLKP